MIDWIDIRLKEWARWLASSADSGRGYQVSSINRWYQASGWNEGSARVAVIPVNDIQAVVTNRAVMRLEPMRRAVVEVYYAGRYETSYAMAESLGVALSTFYLRLNMAHVELEGVL